MGLVACLAAAAPRSRRAGSPFTFTAGSPFTFTAGSPWHQGHPEKEYLMRNTIRGRF